MSDRLKVLAVFGTRPEAIKMAPVVKELERRADRFVSRVCVTAQHRQMLDQVLALFGIAPDYDLNVMQDGQSPTQVAAAVLSRLEPVLQAECPDWVLVQGDTTTVAAAAWAAFYAGVKVGHVEAGLRTFDKRQPFPEEVNRRIASVVADLHFAPTEAARQNLLREGVPAASVHVTGNTVIDALLWAAAQPCPPEIEALWGRIAGCRSQVAGYRSQDAGCGSPVAGQQFGLTGDVGQETWRLVLVTAHRRENFGRPLEQICLALREIALAYPGDVQIIYPVHLNPHVQEPARRILGDAPGVTLTDPLDYLPFVHLMKRSYMVLTDSGGIQEEAPGLGKPVLVLREVTERPEAVAAGTVRVVGTQRERIVGEARRLLEDRQEYERMAHAVNPYGDGRAAERIVGHLLNRENAISHR